MRSPRPSSCASGSGTSSSSRTRTTSRSCAGGTAVVDTWRQDHPYDVRLTHEEYDRRKRLLQIELVKLQNWFRATGERLVVLCEGRDAADKGGTIKRFMEHLNPRGARVVALDKPSEREMGA